MNTWFAAHPSRRYTMGQPWWPYKSAFVLLEIMHSEKSNYIIGGDINLNFLKYQTGTHITDYVNSILSLGCISLINKPTRCTSTHQPSLLDHIYTNIIDDSTTTGSALYDISDQLPIFANFNLHPKCAKKYRPKIRCLKNFWSVFFGTFGMEIKVWKNTDQKFAV